MVCSKNGLFKTDVFFFGCPSATHSILVVSIFCLESVTHKYIHYIHLNTIKSNSLNTIFLQTNKSQQTSLDDTLWRCENLISCQERAGCFLEQCCCCSCCSFSSCSKCPEKCKTSHLGRSWSVELGWVGLGG